MPYRTAEDRDSSAIIKCQKSKCGDIITEIQNYLECNKCNKTFHLKCAGINGINIARASENEKWFCQNCKNTESVKRKNSDNDSPRNDNTSKRQNFGSNTRSPNKMSESDKLDKILQSVNEIKTSQEDLKTTVNEMKDHQLFLSQQIDDFEKKLTTYSKEHEKIRSDLNLYEKIQSQHSFSINNLAADLDVYKQKMLSNNIIIGGLPQNVNINTALHNIMEKLETECTINDISDATILPSKSIKNSNSSSLVQNNNPTPLFLVQFKTNAAKMNLLLKKKEKKSLMVNEIGLNVSLDRQIFIRDHVTKYKMDLFQECREIKLKYNFKYLWMNGSTILMRMQDQSKVYEINSKNDINKIIIMLPNSKTQSQSVCLNNNNTSIGTTQLE